MAKLVFSIAVAMVVTLFSLQFSEGLECYFCGYEEGNQNTSGGFIKLDKSCKTGKKPKDDYKVTCKQGVNDLVTVMKSLNWTGQGNKSSEPTAESWHCIKLVYTSKSEVTIRTCVQQRATKIPDQCTSGNLRELAKKNDTIGNVTKEFFGDDEGNNVLDLFMEAMCACPGDKCNSGTSAELSLSLLVAAAFVSKFGVYLF